MKIRLEIPVGIVFLLAMGVLGYYTIIMSKEVFRQEETYPMVVMFSNVEGLKENATVKVNGVASGSVESVALAGHQVKVSLRLYQRFPLYENYAITIKNETALGVKGVSIFPGYPSDTAGRTYRQLAWNETLEGKLEDPFESFTRMVEENRDNIRVTMLNLRQITEKINAGQGTLGKLINDDGVHSDTNKLVKELREAVEDSREQAPVTSFIRAALTAF
ncbi:MAG: MCE family protein [Spirochaetes bacterium]|nr:MCE family protein [Spirochaetota bacterium]